MVNVFAVVLALTFNTLVFRALEEGYRIFYFLTKEVKKVRPCVHY